MHVDLILLSATFSKKNNIDKAQTLGGASPAWSIFYSRNLVQYIDIHSIWIRTQ